jgi:hypothetical protein
MLAARDRVILDEGVSSASTMKLQQSGFEDD